MRPPARLLLSFALLLSVGLLASPANAALPTCDGTFHAVPSHQSRADEILYGVDGTAPGDVWSGGISFARGSLLPLMLHWDGTAWTRFPVGGAGRFTEVANVDTRTADDAWAVGQRLVGFALKSALLHWNGTKWRVFATKGGGFESASDVAAFGPHDVWTVGDRLVIHPARPPSRDRLASTFRVAAARGARPNQQALAAAAGARRSSFEESVIRHFDGTRWRSVRHPTAGTGWTELRAVDGASRNDVWAVGIGHVTPARGDDIETGGRTLIEHFDGRTWKHVRSPSPGSERNSLYGVDAVTGDDAWAVGLQRGGHTRRPLVLHYDGSRWSPVAAPSYGRSSELLSVSAAGPDDVWATGVFRGDKGEFHKLIEHFDGTSWSVVHDGYPGTGAVYALGLAAVDGQVWWVGASAPNEYGPFDAATALRC